MFAVVSDAVEFEPPGIAYFPRNYTPVDPNALLSRDQVLDDLRLLRSVGFRSLVTYAANGQFGSIPELARQEGFDGTVIMGIWDPASEEEMRNALTQAAFVDGYCVGNEGLGLRYEPEELAPRMIELRRSTGRPVTTSERIEKYLSGAYRGWLLKNSDWLFPIAHPFWHFVDDPKEAAHWVLSHYDRLVADGTEVVFKEVGVPTGGKPGYGEEFQLAFFQLVEPADIPFFYFEAFDQPWKLTDEYRPEAEANWGLHHADGSPKVSVLWLRSRFSLP